MGKITELRSKRQSKKQSKSEEIALYCSDLMDEIISIMEEDGLVDLEKIKQENKKDFWFAYAALISLRCRLEGIKIPMHIMVDNIIDIQENEDGSWIGKWNNKNDTDRPKPDNLS